MQSAKTERKPYIDALRTAAILLVIINHTNSRIFQGSDPSSAIWYISIAYYYLAKAGVSIFVMVSGICLLPKNDSLTKAAFRFLRVLATLIIFSYIYFVYAHGLSAALNVRGFLSAIWRRQATDSFWYLYLYLTLLLAMPLIQRLVKSLDKALLNYYLIISLGLMGFWPLLTHYFPQAEFIEFADFSVFQIFLGLLVAGYYIGDRATPTRRGCAIAACVLILSLMACVWLTRGEYYRNPAGKYWFMDDRRQPTTFILAVALALVYLARGLLDGRALPGKAARALAATGGCAFGIYLLQDMAIDMSTPLYGAMAARIGRFPAVLIWEALVFAACFVVTLILKRIPGVKRLL